MEIPIRKLLHRNAYTEIAVREFGCWEPCRGQAALRRRSYGLWIFGEVLVLAIILVGAGWKLLPDNHEALDELAFRRGIS